MEPKDLVDILISNYPTIFVPYEGNPGNLNWSLPIGWIKIVDILCYHLTYYNKYRTEGTPPVTCVQMKEKLGGLRFYVEGANPEVNRAIGMAESMCYKTCAHCGGMHNVGMKTGWIEPICETCFDNNKENYEKRGVKFHKTYVDDYLATMYAEALSREVPIDGAKAIDVLTNKHYNSIHKPKDK